MKTIACIAAAVCSLSGASAQPLVASSFLNQIVDVDPTTGAVSNVRNVNLPSGQFMTGISLGPSPSSYYTVGATQDGAARSTLYSVDRLTGAATPFAALGARLVEGELRYNPIDRSFYASWATDSRLLYRINEGGNVSTITLPSFLRDPSGLAFSSAGELYVLETSQSTSVPGRVVVIDLESVTITREVVLDRTIGLLAGLEFVGEDLVVADRTGAFYNVDALNGATTLRFQASITDLSGIALVPAPGAAGVALMMLATSSRRRRRI
ncbi:MAG: hypothetical protein SFZ23_15315 [Planctomycetota bacterium]|nr:hypothetical protein [Planctomycetota bacterium]